VRRNEARKDRPGGRQRAGAHCATAGRPQRGGGGRKEAGQTEACVASSAEKQRWPQKQTGRPGGGAQYDSSSGRTRRGTRWCDPRAGANSAPAGASKNPRAGKGGCTGALERAQREAKRRQEPKLQQRAGRRAADAGRGNGAERMAQHRAEQDEATGLDAAWSWDGRGTHLRPGRKPGPGGPAKQAQEPGERGATARQQPGDERGGAKAASHTGGRAAAQSADGREPARSGGPQRRPS